MPGMRVGSRFPGPHSREATGVAVLTPFPEHEVPRDRHRARVDLDERVIHHAGRVMLRALRVEPGPVRHRARRDARDLRHLIHVHDRHGRRLHLAVQVEVHDVRVEPVGRDLERRGERAERDGATQGIADGAELPQLAVRKPVRGGDVVVPFVGRQCDAVWADRLGGISSDLRCALDPRAARPEPNERDTVVPFARHEQQIVDRWRLWLGAGAGRWVTLGDADLRRSQRHPATSNCTQEPAALHGTTLSVFGFTRTTHKPLLKSFTYARPSFGFTTTPHVNAAFFVLPVMSAVLSDAISRPCDVRSPLSSPEMSNTWKPASYAPM